jgi:mono/diheme cytochrome c family protein
MRRALKGLGVALGFLLVLGGLGVAFVEIRGLPSFPTEPLPGIVAVNDPQVIEKGRYLATHVSHCPACHGPPEAVSRWELGPPDDLRGGFPIPGGPFGTFYPSNLTPDVETGIGKLSDGQLARAIRTGVLHDGSIGLVMQTAVGELSDEDLTAVVSYLRSIPPVSNAVPRDQLRFLAKAMSGIMKPRHGPRPDRPDGMADLFKPRDPTAVPQTGVSVERGAYLATGPAICVGCHTARDPLQDFAMVGPPFGGGREPIQHRERNGYEFMAPNLTTDPKTGRLAGWSEDQFVARFRAGRAFPGSPMQWECFQGMRDEDLRSIFRFLQQVPPVERDVGPSYRKSGWKPGDPT